MSKLRLLSQLTRSCMGRMRPQQEKKLAARIPFLQNSSQVIGNQQTIDFQMSKNILKTLDDYSLYKRQASNGGFRGGGDDGHHFGSYYQQKLKEFLKKQGGDETWVSYKTYEKKGSYFSTTTFKSFFAAMNPQPRLTEEDAIEAAAKQALLQQNLYSKHGDPCTTLDIFCRQVTGLPPIYHVASFTPAVLYNTTIHMFNPEMKKSTKIYLQTTVSSAESQKINREQFAAKLSVIDHPNYRHDNKDYKEALNELCLKNGGTLPFYNKYLYSTTVTSLIKKELSNENRNVKVMRDGGTNGKNLNCLNVDMLETTSIQPMRTSSEAEDSAAKLMLFSLRNYLNTDFDDKKFKGNYPFKAKLKYYSSSTGCPLAIHTEKIIPQMPLYDCTVTSKSFKKALQTFTITCDGKGYKSKNEARESAARKSFFMLGLDPDDIIS